MFSHYNGSEFITYALLGGRETATPVRFMQLAVVYLYVCHHSAKLHGLGWAYGIIGIYKP